MRRVFLMLIILGLKFQVFSQMKQDKDYSVAAYVWPSCHDEEMSRETLWGEGIGEWEIIQKGNPRFEGHYQPKIPLWGYGYLEAVKEVMSGKYDKYSDK